MEFPEPTIDVEAEAAELFAAASKPFGQRAVARSRLRALLAQAWDEGRGAPPGACLNPYGAAPAMEGATGVCPLCGAPLLNYNEPCTCTLNRV